MIVYPLLYGKTSGRALRFNEQSSVSLRIYFERSHTSDAGVDRIPATVTPGVFSEEELGLEMDVAPGVIFVPEVITPNGVTGYLQIGARSFLRDGQSGELDAQDLAAHLVEWWLDPLEEEIVRTAHYRK